MTTSEITTVITSLLAFVSTIYVIRLQYKYNRLKEREVFIHQVQFQKEFEILQELWKSTTTLTGKFVRLKIGLDKSEKDKGGFEKIMDDIEVLHHSFIGSRPFISSDIADKMNDIFENYLEDSTRISENLSSFVIPYMDHIDDLENLIRQRILVLDQKEQKGRQHPILLK